MYLFLSNLRLSCTTAMISAFAPVAKGGRVPLLSSTTVLQIIDSVAMVVNQAYRMARLRLTSTASPIIRMMVQRDHAICELELLRRELEIFRGQRESLPPHRRPDYEPRQRFAILQHRRLRGWSVKKTAQYFV